MKRVFSMAVFVVFVLGLLLGVTSIQPVLAAGCDASNIIFSEIDYDQPSTDIAEFLELFIPNGTIITDCEVRFINGANTTQYNITSIAGTYSSGTYLHLGVGGDIVIGGGCVSDCIQNGAPDGFALIDTSSSGNIVWFYSYEGVISGYDPGDGSSNTTIDIGVSDQNTTPNFSLVNGSVAGVSDTTRTFNVTPGAANENDSGTPNVISLQSFSAQKSNIGAMVIFTFVVVMGGAMLFIRRRNTI